MNLVYKTEINNKQRMNIRLPEHIFILVLKAVSY